VNRTGSALLWAAVIIIAALAPACFGAAGWTEEFVIDKSDMASVGRNPYFILEPGYQLVFKGGDADLIITVLDETTVIDGVETRVVEERESEGGQLVEVSRNFFAISKRHNGVFYFGEDVDTYKDGKLKGHGGAWRAGEKGNRAGLMMPGLPLLGARYYQEVAPKVAMDRAEIVSINETMKTPAGEFKNVLKTEETTPLESGKEYKYYAAGIGLIRDGGLLLVRHGMVK